MVVCKISTAAGSRNGDPAENEKAASRSLDRIISHLTAAGSRSGDPAEKRNLMAHTLRTYNTAYVLKPLLAAAYICFIPFINITNAKAIATIS